jgi:hypothetical protein
VLEVKEDQYVARMKETLDLVERKQLGEFYLQLSATVEKQDQVEKEVEQNEIDLDEYDRNLLNQ